MSEMYPEKPLIPDESLVILHAELEAARAAGGQEAVDGIWADIERYTQPQAMPEYQDDHTAEVAHTGASERRFPEDYSEQEILALTATVDSALRTVTLGLSRLFMSLGPPPQELLDRYREEKEQEE